MEIFEEYRPLQPKRTQKETPPINEIKTCSIIIQITRGYHFPVRKGEDDDTYRNYRQERLKNASELGLEMRLGAREAGTTNIYDSERNTQPIGPTDARETINYITMARSDQEQSIPDVSFHIISNLNIYRDCHHLLQLLLTEMCRELKQLRDLSHNSIKQLRLISQCQIMIFHLNHSK